MIPGLRMRCIFSHMKFSMCPPPCADHLHMVCEDCNKKAGRCGVITPDIWKDGAKNTTESGGRSVKSTNMLLNRQVRACQPRTVPPGGILTFTPEKMFLCATTTTEEICFVTGPRGRILICAASAAASLKVCTAGVFLGGG